MSESERCLIFRRSLIKSSRVVLEKPHWTKGVQIRPLILLTIRSEVLSIRSP